MSSSRGGAPGSILPSESRKAAPSPSATQHVAVLRSLCLGEDLHRFSEASLLDAFRLAVAHGGYDSACELRRVLQHRGLSLRRQRAFERASARLDAALTRDHPGGAGARSDALDASLGWLRGGCPPATPERWLHKHNAHLPTSNRDLQAFNRYLSGFSSLRAANSGTATPWLGGLSFSCVPRGATGPLVSVLMAARNARATIQYALDSMLQQTYANLEVLVCDDASSDDTPSLLVRRYGGDPRVRLYRSLVQQGPYNAKNALLSHALGEYVTTHDADDLALPTRISSQLEAAMRPGRVGSITRWLRLRADGSVVFFADGKARRLCIASLLVRREHLREIGGYPPARVGADLDVYGRLKAKVGAPALCTVDAPQVLGLWERGSLTRTPGMEALESGYRSPVRRAYSERIFRRDLVGASEEEQEPLEVFLARTGNFLEPQCIENLMVV